MPNPCAFRAMSLLAWYPYTRWLHVQNPHYIPPPKDEDGQWIPEPNPSFDREHQIDWYSWFMEDSQHFKNMPEVGLRFRQHRWILTRCAYLRTRIANDAPVDIPPVDYTAKRMVTSKRKQDGQGEPASKPKSVYVVPNSEVLRLILKWSPKVAAILALLVKHVILQDEKVIIWFTYRTTLDLFREIMLELPYFSDFKAGRWDTLVADTSHEKRHKLQEALNDPAHPLKVALISNKVGAIGLNFQKGCSKQIHADTAETYDNELQGIGRSFRLGQLIDVIIYSFVIAGTMDHQLVE